MPAMDSSLLTFLLLILIMSFFYTGFASSFTFTGLDEMRKGPPPFSIFFVPDALKFKI